MGAEEEGPEGFLTIFNLFKTLFDAVIEQIN